MTLLPGISPASTATDVTGTQVAPSTTTESALELQPRWHVIVVNDPVNLMSYVVIVLRKVLGFDEETARKHMLEVHEAGRSIVWTGLREKAEHYAFILQQWHLNARIESDQ